MSKTLIRISELKAGMPYRDLPEFLEVLENNGELRKVKAQVDPKHEIGAICRILSVKKGPAVLFSNVKGHSMPVVGQLLGSYRRIALALETDEGKLLQEVVTRASKPLPTKRVSNGPCQEVVKEGEEVDLRELPLVTNNPRDGGQYITAGHVIIKDPEFGMNMAIYRMMYLSKNKTFMRFSPGHHGFEFFKNAEKRGVKKMDVAVAIGVDPSIYIGSLYAARLGEYELDIAGGLRGEPVDVVNCVSSDLEVPAYSEIVLEGEISIPPETGTEGPFGEFMGYVTSSVPNEKIMTIKAVTRKERPIYHNVWLGKPPHESLYIDAITYAAAAYQELRRTYPAIKAAHAPVWGCSQVLIIQIEERLKRPGLVNNLLASALSTKGGMWKYVIAVDEDIETSDPIEVFWAITTRCQPHRDFRILDRCYTSRLDPSSTSEGITSKLFIDATKKEDFRGEVAEPTKEMYARTLSRWSEFDLG